LVPFDAFYLRLICKKIKGRGVYCGAMSQVFPKKMKNLRRKPARCPFDDHWTRNNGPQDHKWSNPMINATHMKIALLAGLIAVGGAAQAKSGDDNKAAMFEQIDADGNGAVTQEELKAHAQARFDKADANKDGFLTADEMQAQRAAHAGERGGKRAEKMLERHDTNKDGKLDAAELEAASEGRQGKRAAKMMERVDANSDGKLSFEELNGRRDPAKMFAKLDTNEDGSLSAEEFEKARKHHGKRHGKDHSRKAD
jgi:Ca2+-binding EF-hand superfamily protein